MTVTDDIENWPGWPAYDDDGVRIVSYGWIMHTAGKAVTTVSVKNDKVFITRECPISVIRWIVFDRIMAEHLKRGG